MGAPGDASSPGSTARGGRRSGGVKQAGWPPYCGRLWQRNYFEHIIRDEKALEGIRHLSVGATPNSFWPLHFGTACCAIERTRRAPPPGPPSGVMAHVGDDTLCGDVSALWRRPAVTAFGVQ